MENNKKEDPQQQKKEIKINIQGDKAVLGGAYANHTMIHMTREELTLDFINVIPPHATLNARVIVSPAHFKRALQVMQGTLERFEKEFGVIPATNPAKPPAEFVQ